MDARLDSAPARLAEQIPNPQRREIKEIIRSHLPSISKDLKDAFSQAILNYVRNVGGTHREVAEKVSVHVVSFAKSRGQSIEEAMLEARVWLAQETYAAKRKKYEEQLAESE